ncbi:hypothetical protein [Ramlibacter sp.]|uniref:hypothetical protein n=1 Tax=Ramlibacter sp. TaxID=1917967 RepID=UPI003D1158FD
MASGRGVTIADITEVFFRMETDARLFSAKAADGIYYWDMIRSEVYLSLHTLLGGPFTLPEPLPAPSWKSRAKDLVKPLVNMASRRYMQARSPKYIFITAQRVREGTRIVDNITDPLYDLFPDDAVAVELLNRSAVHLPSLLACRKTTRIPPVALRIGRDEQEATKIAGRLDDAIDRHFGLRPGFTRLVGDSLSMHRATLAHYRLALRKCNPKVIVGVNNGSLKGMFLAAKERGIPVVELQHGASTRHTIYWSYPTSITADEPGLSLPFAYLTYSEYWRRNTHFPVRLTRAIGNDSLFTERVASDGRDVLMVSSYMYREALADLAREIAAMDRSQLVYFKLHPHEFDRKEEIIAGFTGHANIHVVCDELAFPELFRKCGYAVGVQSTVFYFALQAGCRVCLLKRSNYFWHDDILDHVELFEDAQALHDITHRPGGEDSASRVTLPEYARRLDTRAFLSVLDDVQSMTGRARTNS